MKECTHVLLVKDMFIGLRGVTRTIPGDCVCAKCGDPVPVHWNNGKLILADLKAITSNKQEG